jgi:glucosyl-dolichyl phosphate glucuronosyltransferase
MKLHVVVPTYNRIKLLQRTIESLLSAPVPSGLDVTICVVDNNSKDDTEQIVRKIQSEAALPILYIKEEKQGLSHARNAGIQAATGDLVGFIDDDEKIDHDWYNVAAREFAVKDTQFIGGPYLPEWEIPAPRWLPPGYHSVIGVVVPKPRGTFDNDFPGSLMGGNAIVRRNIFDQIGVYSVKLGRSGKGLLSDEDDEFYQRLLRAGIHGMYVPDLLIHHHVPANRLTRKYHRSWCYWRGASKGYLSRKSQESVRHLLGIPRYRIGRAVKGFLAWPFHLLIARAPEMAFKDELASWDLFGFIYGRYFIRMDKFYGKQS